MTFTLQQIVDQTDKVIADLKRGGTPERQLEIIELGFLILRAELGIQLASSTREEPNENN